MRSLRLFLATLAVKVFCGPKHLARRLKIYNQAVTTTSIPESAVLRRSFRKAFPAAVRGEGVYIFDADGNRYLDFSGSAVVNFIGHGVQEISVAMAEQAAQLEFVHTSQFTTPVAEAYAEELLDFAGEHFRGGAVYFTSGGSESIETALKLARQYQVEMGQPNRYQVLSRQQSYHGSTLGALSVSGNRKRREMYLPMVKEFAHAGMPYCYRCKFDCTDSCYNCGQQYAAELEQAIAETKGAAAAFVFEPLSGATLGAVVPPPGYLEKISEVCRANGVLLIADEVMTGMIRKHHLPHRFPADVLAEAQSVENVIPGRELNKRRDYRDLPIVTIDGETARDFDDAVHVRQLDNGNYELQVHIADVAQYVTEDSPLDQEARLRGTSVYFPDRAVPMSTRCIAIRRMTTAEGSL